MTKRFTHDSDDQPNPAKPDQTSRLEVEISIIPNGADDAYAEILSIENLETKQFVEYADLSPRDQVDIDRHAAELANDHAHEAWFDEQLRRADSVYESMRDGD